MLAWCTAYNTNGHEFSQLMEAMSACGMDGTGGKYRLSLWMICRVAGNGVPSICTTDLLSMKHSNGNVGRAIQVTPRSATKTRRPQSRMTLSLLKIRRRESVRSMLRVSLTIRSAFPFRYRNWRVFRQARTSHSAREKTYGVRCWGFLFACSRSRMRF